jgi:hypothetical protein
MATLTTPHWEAVTPAARDLLIVLGQLPSLRPFYLGGGTALALRLGHRISQDLDLFANIETLDDSVRRSIVEELRKGHSVNLLQDSPLGLVLEVDGQAVSFFSYGYPLLQPTELVSGVQVAGILDIGLMKLDAIAGRGMRKDFYDLYFIVSHVSLDELFSRSTGSYQITLSEFSRQPAFCFLDATDLPGYFLKFNGVFWVVEKRMGLERVTLK